jgi:hypothetical protein
MRKLRILIYTNRDVKKLEEYGKKHVDFIKEPLGRIGWTNYRDYRIPNNLEKLGARAWEKYGMSIDGIMVIPDDWENGKKKINGVHLGVTFSSYQVTLVKDTRKYYEVAMHEIKHMLDNLMRTYHKISAEAIVGVRDWDDDVVHDKHNRYYFEYQLEQIWPYVEKVIERRRLYDKLSAIAKALEALLVIIAQRNMKEKVTPETDSKVYKYAKGYIGRDASPRDLVSDALGCAESLSTLLRELDPTFPLVTGTWSLYDVFEARSDWQRVTDPEIGDIILSVTGMGNGRISNGHTGVISDNNRIMSNNSNTGLWDEHLNMDWWHDYYGRKGGYPIYYYRKN